MGHWGLPEGLKKAVGEIEEGGVSAFGLSSAYMYGLGGVAPENVPAKYREEFDGIVQEYAGAAPGSAIDDSLAANSMLMLDDGELEKLAGRIKALYEKVSEEEHSMEG